MFEQDYIMRLIKEMVRFILKMVFHIDTESPTADLLEAQEEKAALDAVFDMVDNGFINEAENKVFEWLDSGDKRKLEMILLFFSYLNDKSDEFLEENNFTRKEIQEDLKIIMAQYGLGDMAEIFLP